VSTIKPTMPLPASSSGTQLRQAAFFDLDRTLVAGSSGFSILIEMARAGIVSRRSLLRDTWVSARFRLWGLDDATTDAVRTRVSGYVAGVETDRLEAISAAVLERVLPRVYPEVLERAREHQRRGEPVYLVTASSQEFADLLADVLELDGAVGTRSEIVDGRYTGKPGGPFIYGEGKVAAMLTMAEEEGLDLTGSAAYSDSISDLPMLRAVGRPIAVNPDRALREVAAKEGWEVLAVDQLAKRARLVTASTLGVVVAFFSARYAVSRRHSS
jgi:HAD superfamily hydrolase (TIGR01490 family)